MAQLPGAPARRSLTPPGRDRRRSSQRRGTGNLGPALSALLRNPLALEEEFAEQAAASFRRRAGDVPGARLSFEDTISSLRDLGLEDFVDGVPADGSSKVQLGGGDDARRQLRLWCGSGVDFGVTDERCFVWIAYRGKRFIDLAQILAPIFNTLDTDRDSFISHGDMDAVLGACRDSGTSSLQSDVRELFAYHSGRSEHIDFAAFVSLTCDVQERSGLHRLAGEQELPVPCMLRCEDGVTFLRPVTAEVFAQHGAT